MSVSQELEKIRTGLEEESRSLTEERKLLEDKAKTLRDKVAIEELRKNNMGTRDEITKLKTEIKELEQRLSGACEAPAPNQQPQETITESVATLNPEVSPQPQQPNDKKKEEKRRSFF
jgi:predicted  nucleic acid-binding Zn-ribbon protein